VLPTTQHTSLWLRTLSNWKSPFATRHVVALTAEAIPLDETVQIDFPRLRRLHARAGARMQAVRSTRRGTATTMQLHVRLVRVLVSNLGVGHANSGLE
jgi:hypothetical protein